jgi:hypothetical protein
MAITWKKLAYEADTILKSLVTAKGDLIVGTGNGAVDNLAKTTDGFVLTVEDANANGMGLKWAAPAAPAAHTLNSHSVPNGAVDFDLQQATDLVVMTVANEAALPAGAGTVAVGQLCWATGELSLHICTVAA